YSTSAAKNSDTRQTADGDKGAEFYRRPEGVEIVAVMKQRDEVIQADNWLEKPNGSTLCSEYHNASPAGQIKKITVMMSCGATSR
ncbi:hypothetical protein SJH87_12755, partial [Staphylococcus sp. GCP4]|nr:hypothetical protein [Staphylococcus sp. GCP4]